MEVAEFLLEQGADVNAHDKGGLIPLHNAASYGHLDLAALLIKYNTAVNATDNWDYTPLHEAAQKGRTQLSALLVSLTNFLIQYIPYLKFSSLDTNLLLFNIFTIYINCQTRYFSWLTVLIHFSETKIDKLLLI